MWVTIQIFILFGVVIVQSLPHHVHQRNNDFSDFFEDTFGSGSIFHNGENPLNLDPIPSFRTGVFGAVNLFGSGDLFGSNDPQQDVNFNGDIGIRGNDIPNLNTGMDDEESSSVEVNNPVPTIDINLVPKAQTSDTHDKKEHANDTLLNNFDVEVAKTNKRSSESQEEQNSKDSPNADTNQIQINGVLDNVEGQKNNTDPVINAIVKESVPQNKSEENKDGSIEHEITVPVLDSSNINKGILMIDPEMKINDTDVGLNKYRDVIVFPDNLLNNLMNRIGDGNNNYSSSTDNVPIKLNSEQKIPVSNNQDKQNQYVNEPNSPSSIMDNSNQEVPVKNSNGSPPDNAAVYPNIPNNNFNIGVNKPGQIYKPGNSGTTGNPGQVYVPGNLGVNKPGQVYTLGTSGDNSLGQIYLPGNSGANSPSQVYLPSNNGQVYTPSNFGVNRPGQIYVPSNTGANSPSQVYVPSNNGQVYTPGGYSNNNSPAQIYVPTNSGGNSPGQVYVPNNNGQIYAPGNYGANSPGQIYVPNNPISGDQITNGLYYNVIQSNNGQTFLVPNNNGPPHVVDKGQNTPWYGQINKGQTYIPVKYNPAVPIPNGQTYLLLGNNLPGNTVTQGIPGNVIVDKPTNNVPLLISYKDKEGDDRTSV